jgi:CDP-diacylglycerol--serine O-phosphatidyltransferase
MFPPFDPEKEDRKPRGRMFARGQIPTRVLIPNIFTLLGLCAGLTAIRMAIEHRWDLAVAALVFAAFLDGIDGRIARLLKAQSRFGAELDSLADFVNFGVAPAIIIFNWALDDLHSLGWIAVLVFTVCSALRLARFNVSLDATDTPAWKSSYFVGVPAPAGAIILLLPIYVQDLGLHLPRLTPLVLVSTLAIALLMVRMCPPSRR